MIEIIQIVRQFLLFKIINCDIYLNHIRLFRRFYLRKEFNLINEWSIMDILYNITFPSNVILE